MEDRKVIIEKRIECIIGIFFLIPPVLGVVELVLQLFDLQVLYLASHWTARFSSDGGGGMSALPIYMALMAFVGAYLIKDKLRYFVNDKNNQPNTDKTNNEQ